MQSTTLTETPGEKKMRLVRGRSKWQAVVDALYQKLQLTPGNRNSLAHLKIKTRSWAELQMIDQIKQGEKQIQIFTEQIQALSPSSVVEES